MKGETLFIDGIPKEEKDTILNSLNRCYGKVIDTYVYKHQTILMNLAIIKIGNENYGVDYSFLYKLSKGIENIEQHTSTVNNGFRYYIKKHNLLYSSLIYNKQTNHLEVLGVTKDGFQKLFTVSNDN